MAGDAGDAGDGQRWRPPFAGAPSSARQEKLITNATLWVLWRYVGIEHGARRACEGRPVKRRFTARRVNGGPMPFGRAGSTGGEHELLAGASQPVREGRTTSCWRRKRYALRTQMAGVSGLFA